MKRQISLCLMLLFLSGCALTAPLEARTEPASPPVFVMSSPELTAAPSMPGTDFAEPFHTSRVCNFCAAYNRLHSNRVRSGIVRSAPCSIRRHDAHVEAGAGSVLSGGQKL